MFIRWLNGRTETNLRERLVTEAHLDAAESVSPLLTALFAIHERGRPFNKFLRWELAEDPLGDPLCHAETLPERLRTITSSEISPSSKDSSATRSAWHVNTASAWSSIAGSPMCRAFVASSECAVPVTFFAGGAGRIPLLRKGDEYNDPRRHRL
jgi:hypothetical protein